jgi:hypothetical protein
MNHVLFKVSGHNLKFPRIPTVLISAKSINGKESDVYSLTRDSSTYQIKRHIADDEVDDGKPVSLSLTEREKVDATAFVAFDIGLFMLELLAGGGKVNKERVKDNVYGTREEKRPTGKINKPRTIDNVCGLRRRWLSVRSRRCWQILTCTRMACLQQMIRIGMAGS